MYSTQSELEQTIGLEDRGRFELTHKPADTLMFKVPSLRNVARTAPYFHNGSREYLENAIRDMAKLQLGQELSSKEIGAIAAFLESLNGEIEGTSP